MTEDFIPDSSQASNPETPVPNTPSSEPQRHPVKVAIFSSPEGVTSTIHNFYRMGYAHVSEWSKPKPTQKPGEVVSILSRSIRIE